MKVTAETLAERPVKRLRIRSLGLGLYTVEATLDDGWAVLCDNDGKVCQFTGMEWVRRRLAHLDVEQATLVHSSAYHEMIGLAREQVAPLEVPVDWPASRH
ncbi:MAG: DUF6482 family protein [Alcanivoracaceae bacterium]|jgi:hypothetical protein|nr:DUF6482 family protein [Alcanivoracaceae bacterium]